MQGSASLSLAEQMASGLGVALNQRSTIALLGDIYSHEDGQPVFPLLGLFLPLEWIELVLSKLPTGPVLVRGVADEADIKAFSRCDGEAVVASGRDAVLRLVRDRSMFVVECPLHMHLPRDQCPRRAHQFDILCFQGGPPPPSILPFLATADLILFHRDHRPDSFCSELWEALPKDSGVVHVVAHTPIDVSQLSDDTFLRRLKQLRTFHVAGDLVG